MIKITLTKKAPQKVKTKNVDPLNGNLFKSIIAFAIPLMLTGILQLAFNAADMIVVGQAKGGDPVGQVGATSSLINLIVNLFIGLSVGTSVNVSREFGTGNRKKISDFVHTSLAVALIGGVLCTFVGFFGARYFLELMGTVPSHIDGSTLYMKIYFLSMPASMIYNFCSAILRAAGNSKTPLVILSTAGIVNVVFNLFFVLACGMGVEGVALATVISQYVAMVWIIIYLTRTDGPEKLFLKQIRIDKQCLGSILRVGIPSGISGSLFSISNVVVQSSINSFNLSAVVNGNAAASSIEGFLYTASNALHQSAITFIGQNRGAGKFDRIRKTVWVCVTYSVVFELIIALILFALKKPLLGVYLGKDSEAIAVGITRMIWIVIPHFFCGVMDVLNGSARGFGASLTPTAISLILVCGLRVLWLNTVFEYHNTLETVYVIYPISWFLCSVSLAVLFVILYKIELKKQRSLLDTTKAS